VLQEPQRANLRNPVAQVRRAKKRHFSKVFCVFPANLRTFRGVKTFFEPTEIDILKSASRGAKTNTDPMPPNVAARRPSCRWASMARSESCRHVKDCEMP
jgi:hypothetical protein